MTTYIYVSLTVDQWGSVGLYVDKILLLLLRAVTRRKTVVEGHEPVFTLRVRLGAHRDSSGRGERPEVNSAEIFLTQHKLLSASTMTKHE